MHETKVGSRFSSRVLDSKLRATVSEIPLILSKMRVLELAST